MGPCICQKALGKRNGTYVKDIFVLYGAEAFRRADDDHRDLTPEEAKEHVPTVIFPDENNSLN